MLNVMAESADFSTAVNASLVVQIWHDQTTLEGVHAMRDAISRQVHSGAHKFFWLIVTTHAKAPPADARDAIADLMHRYRDRVSACGLVFEGGGFAAATVRAVVTGLTVISQHPFPYKVFPEIEKATAWFHAVAQTRTSLSTIETAADDIREVRHKHAQRFARAG